MVCDEPALARWLAAIDTADLVALDTETTSLDPMQARIVGVSLSIAPGSACYIPLGHRYAGAPDQLDRDATLRRLAPWLADPAKKKLGQNMKYDQHAFANDDLALRGVAHDTLLESYVIESHKPHDMDNLAWRHLNLTTISYDDVTGKGAKRIPFEQVAIDRATEYAAEDADITLRLHRALHPAIAADAKLDYIYAQIEMPVRDVLFRMERNGILIDSNAARAAEPRTGRAGDGAGAAGAPARRAAVQPRIAEAAGRDPVPADEPAGGQEDRDRAAVHRRGSAAGARGRLSVAQGAARASFGVEAQVDVHRQAAADGQCANGPRAHDVLAGHGRHRAARVERSQPAEHPGAHRGGPPHSRGLHRAARITCSSRPTIRRSNCGSWRTCRRTPRCSGHFTRARTSIAPRPAKSSA